MAERGPDFGIEHFISPDAANEVVCHLGEGMKLRLRLMVLGHEEPPEGYTDKMIINIGRALGLLDQIEEMVRE